MSSERQLAIYPDKPALAIAVAERFLAQLQATLQSQPIAHVALTGGTMGGAVLAAVNKLNYEAVDWARIHFWWGDERWLPANDAERNDKQAFDALLSDLNQPANNVHAFPAERHEYPDDSDSQLAVAAESYAKELAAYGTSDAAYPVFDITFLGMGPDGHVASLFPDHNGINITDRTVIPVRNSPKPPPERLSLTRPILNASKQIWLVVAGTDKALALKLALAGASRDEVPAAGVKGREQTIFFADRAAASQLTESSAN